MSKKEGREDMMREQFEQSVHQGQLAEGGDTNAPRVLEALSDVEDDMDVPIETMEWLVNSVESTTKLSEEDVRSLEWVKEYARELAKSMYPTEYGVRGHFRAYAADDSEMWETPISQKEMVKIEGAMETSKQTSKRSKEGWAAEISTKDIRESIARDERENSNSSGILGRIRG